MVSDQYFALSMCVEIFGFFTVDAKEPFACYVKRNASQLKTVNLQP